VISQEKTLWAWEKVLKLDRRKCVGFKAGEKSRKADRRDPKLNTQ